VGGVLSVYASVDLGGTNIACAVGDTSHSIATLGERGPEDVLARMVAAIQALVPQGARLEGVGVGVPGLLDGERRSTLFLPNLTTQWRGVPVAERLEKALGCPVRLLNDARLAALGELEFGVGRRVSDFVFLTLGTGIGGGVVLDGKLRLGPFGAAGELGHLTILPDGPPCGCGARGCLETLASATALRTAGLRLLQDGQAPRLREMVGGDEAAVSTETMARCGDAAIDAAIDKAARYLGIGIAQVVHTLHPQAIVLGGGLAKLGDRLFGPAREEMLRRVRMFPADEIEILASEAGENAALLGGFVLAERGVR